MWWLILLTIFGFVSVLFVVVYCIVSCHYKETERLNRLSREGTQSTLRHFYDVEENKDEENE